MERQREYIHSWYVFIITTSSLIFLLLNKNLPLSALLISVVLFLYVKNGLAAKRFFKVFSYAFFFSFTIFLLAVFNPSKALQTGSVYKFLNVTFFKSSVDKAFLTMMKLFMVSFLSICSSSAINYTKVILHLIVHKGLKLIWGYPFLLAINSIHLLKDEYERIKLNAHLRKLPFKDKIFLFFPLLVFAIRHSQRGALSLVTRGLNDKKTFYFSYDLSLMDKRRLFYFGVFYFALVVAAQITLR
jgi:energy-coupling factor transporter transmembrane protein EcfT